MAVRNVAVWNGAAQDVGTDQANVDAGSQSAPGLVFGNDGDTGLYLLGTDQIAITCGGRRKAHAHQNTGFTFQEASQSGFDGGDAFAVFGNCTQEIAQGNTLNIPRGNSTGVYGEATNNKCVNDSCIAVAGNAKVTGLANGISSVVDLAAFRGRCEVGLLSDPEKDQFTATTIGTIWAMAPTGDAYTTFAAFYCESINASSNKNWAFHHAGTAPSYFGGNVQIGTNSVGNGTNTLVVANGTAPTSNIANSAQVYASSGDLFCRTAAGEVFKLTGGGAPVQSVTKTSGEAGGTNIEPGMVVYSSSATEVKRSKADSASTKDSIGFVVNAAAVASGGTATVQTDGIVPIADWTDALQTPADDGVDAGGGVYTLKSGSVYYASATSDGKTTVTPPSSAGSFIAPVGLALSATEMLIYTSLAQVVAATPVVATTRPNSLLNGGFDLFQRTDPTVETTRADNTYGPDRWIVLTDAGTTDIKISRTTGSTNARNACRLKQTNATSKKFGIAQIIETANTYPFRQKEARFQVSLKASTNTDVRIAVLEWTGTADTLGINRDVVGSWPNSADANPATFFFLSSNFNVLGHAKATIGTSFQQLGVNVNVGASANNLIVVVWTEDAVAQNDTLDVTEAGLYVATANPVIWTPVPFSDELARCNRYYQKTYNADAPPGSAQIYGCTPPARAFDADNLVGAPFTTIMRTNPAVSIYSVNGTANKVSVWPTAADYSAGQTIDSVNYATPRGFVYIQSVGDFNVNNAYFYHWVADAEL